MPIIVRNYWTGAEITGAEGERRRLNAERLMAERDSLPKGSSEHAALCYRVGVITGQHRPLRA